MWPVFVSGLKPLKGHHYWWSLSSIISLVVRPSLHPSLSLRPSLRPVWRLYAELEQLLAPATVHTHLHSPVGLFSLTVQMEGSDFNVKVSPSLVIQLLPQGPKAMLLHTAEIFLSESRCKQKPVVQKLFHVVHRGLHTFLLLSWL